MEQPARGPTFIRPCPQCGQRMEMVSYHDQMGHPMEGALCPNGHAWRAETLRAIAHRIPSVAGEV